MSSSASNANVYGGDEVNALVLDPGSLTTRLGYAGDDFPKVITPSYYGLRSDGSSVLKPASKYKRVFGEALSVPRDNFEVRPIFSDSVVVDWDAAVELYSYYFNTELNIDYKEQPILVTEPLWATDAERRRTVETFYEHFSFPALYLARAPTCVSFQQGRPNCLVVDIGHDSVSVTPVVDGISLLKNSMRTHYAGRYLSDQVADFFTKKYPDLSLINKFRIRSKEPTVYPEEAKFTLRDVPQKITKAFEDYQRELLFHEIKETTLEVPDKKADADEIDDTASRLFELPTGQSVEVGVERYELADSLFEPDMYQFSSEELQTKYPPEGGELDIATAQEDYRPVKRTKRAEANQATPPPSSASGARGLTQLISACLSTIDIDLRASIAHNIIITGGVSHIPQLTDRLYTELTASNPGLKIRLHAVGNSTERLNQAWIGGSILASLGTFHQMWVTKEEYEEVGADRILNQRFR